MDHYVDIDVRPDPEFPVHQLMSALYAKLHRALVTQGSLGIPEAEKQRLVAGVAAQYESEVVYHQINEELERQGVIFVDTSSRKAAESVVSDIRHAIGSFPALPLNAEVAPRSILTSWIAGDPLPHPTLAETRHALSAHYRHEEPDGFATAGLCCYRDGRDSVAWHGDTIGRSSTEDTMVAIVSLGATRVFALRPRGGGPSLRLPQRHGDLLVMGGSCQRTWEHAVPKTARPVGPRVSIQFRPVGVA